MNQQDYNVELIKAFDKEKTQILSNINSFLQKIPSEAVRVNIIISPSENGKGSFCVHGGLNGPHLYGLNKKVEDWTYILDTSQYKNRSVQDFPAIDPLNVEFDVNDIIENTFIQWLNRNWSEISDSIVNVGIAIYSDHI